MISSGPTRLREHRLAKKTQTSDEDEENKPPPGLVFLGDNLTH